MKRYSIEYCGGKYLLVERTESVIKYESTSLEKIREYMKANNIKLIDEWKADEIDGRINVGSYAVRKWRQSR